jgi:tetratricopeptide (TPR) repeat protein
VAALKDRLKTHFVKAEMPKVFTPEELETALRQKLTPEEPQLAVNPLRCNEAMKKWAKDLAGDSSDDMEKARRLFNGLQHKPTSELSPGLRTAERVFRDWSDPKAVFSCEEFAFLYIALAREVHLNAFYVLVTRDSNGNPVVHACAGLFVGGQALLVDPSYGWFGVPHQEYLFENDLQTLALYLGQSHDVNTVKLAIKLSPDSAIPYFNLAQNLARTNDLHGARQALDAGLKLDSKSWLALCGQGVVAAAEHNWIEARSFLNRSLSINPNFGSSRFVLAEVLLQQNAPLEAREQFRKYLQGPTTPREAIAAYEAIARIDQALPEVSSQPTGADVDVIGSK